MKIGVISDTHGNVRAFRKALEYFQGVELIIHAGDVLYHPPKMGCTEDYDIPAFADMLNSLDIPIVIAQGNCDPQVYEELLDMPVQNPYAVAQIDDVRIVANHGHLISANEMVELGRRYKANYFISGHTHIPVLDDRGSVVLMNPGSAAIPKYEVDGKPAPSVGIITEGGAKIVNIEDGSVLMELRV